MNQQWQASLEIGNNNIIKFVTRIFLYFLKYFNWLHNRLNKNLHFCYYSEMNKPNWLSAFTWFWTLVAKVQVEIDPGGFTFFSIQSTAFAEFFVIWNHPKSYFVLRFYSIHNISEFRRIILIWKAVNILCVCLWTYNTNLVELTFE